MLRKIYVVMDTILRERENLAIKLHEHVRMFPKRTLGRRILKMWVLLPCTYILPLACLFVTKFIFFFPKRWICTYTSKRDREHVYNIRSLLKKQSISALVNNIRWIRKVFNVILHRGRIIMRNSLLVVFYMTILIN